MPLGKYTQRCRRNGLGGLGIPVQPDEWSRSAATEAATTTPLPDSTAAAAAPAEPAKAGFDWGGLVTDIFGGLTTIQTAKIQADTQKDIAKIQAAGQPTFAQTYAPPVSKTTGYIISGGLLLLAASLIGGAILLKKKRR